ncbi:HNH endonuclease [Pseudomonas sp. SDT2931_S440]|jgi:hypothetical protein|uniref:HNH endonuclease n=1 Tax=unclassified Pseudomonas TaxID=196821 RepID=UPI0015A1EB7E|nr:MULTISPECIES: HNH endonuclease [unclassified Pseudomonas]NVZ36075.1 HNH endonuclease [Pseudomonas sp. A4002]NWB83096.1 HNH endonuclease [Pseudomonas sp. F9001]
MDQSIAKSISNLLFIAEGRSRYKLEQSYASGDLIDFHQWADGKPCEGAFLFINQQSVGMWIVLIDWKVNGNFYVVIFPESRAGPIAEIHKTQGEGDEVVLSWKYSPTKHDSRNWERKQYFIEAFLSDVVAISIPSGPEEVDDFINELFSLANSRQKADSLDPDKPSTRDGFPEGKMKQTLHFLRERNTELVRQAKLLALKTYGRLICECCGMDFQSVYGRIGADFIEAHHIKPISTLHEDGENTQVEDLAMVCSNCHRMLHRRRPWLERHELKQLLDASHPLQLQNSEFKC